MTHDASMVQTSDSICGSITAQVQKQAFNGRWRRIDWRGCLNLATSDLKHSFTEAQTSMGQCTFKRTFWGRVKILCLRVASKQQQRTGSSGISNTPLGLGFTWPLASTLLSHTITHHVHKLFQIGFVKYRTSQFYNEAFKQATKQESSSLMRSGGFYDSKRAQRISAFLKQDGSENVKQHGLTHTQFLADLEPTTLFVPAVYGQPHPSDQRCTDPICVPHAGPQILGPSFLFNLYTLYVNWRNQVFPDKQTARTAD